MIEIKDISGSVKLSVEEGANSIHRFQLMKEDYVQLQFSLGEPVYFEIGDYIEVEGVPFYITGPTYPTFNTSTAGYDYSIQFDSHYYRWKNHILFYNRQGNREASWSLTRAPEAHLSIVVSNLTEIGFTYNGQNYQAVVESDVDTSAKLVQYDNTNIIDALTLIAEAWDTEWWVDGNMIHLGRCEKGEPVRLEIGKEIFSMTRSQSQDIYATRLYVFGSTRNIPIDYRKSQSGTVVEGVVQKRLMLPVGTPYIDVIDGLSDEEVIEAVVIFEDVYPRMMGTMTTVEAIERTDEGEDGGTYTAYRFTDNSFTFNSQYILPGEELRIQFQTGPLSGMDFGVIFNPDELPEDDPKAQVFEIVRNEDYGQHLPKDPLIPSVGNQYVLYNFDTQYVNDTLLPEAEQELLEKGITYKDKMVSDPSTYTLNMNSYLVSGYDERNGQLNPEKEINLSAGQKVNLVNPAYFKDGRVSRIIGFEKKLDIPYDAPIYTVGETAAYSRLGELEQKIENIQFEGNTYINQGGGGTGFYLIKKDDPTAASDSNVFSALRTLYEINKIRVDMDGMYLRKDIDDTAHGNILFDKNIGSTIFIDDWDGKGWQIQNTGDAILEALRVRSDIFVKRYIGSDAFISGFPNGYGWQVSPYRRTNAAGVEETKYKLEIDDISVRGNLRVYEMIVSQLRGENDNVIFAGMMKVHHYDAATGRIYLDTDEGVLYNPFRTGDILMIQRFGGLPTAENDYNVIKQYELQVAEVGIGDLSDGEERLDWITFTNFVGDLSDITEKDVLTRVDSVADSTRKGIVKVTTIDEIGAPYIDVVYGMKTDPLHATKARMGNLTGIRTQSGIDLTGIWGIYGNGAYFENSTYIMQDGNTIEQNFSILNGKLDSTISSIRNDMSLEAGNILRNSAFSQDTHYWTVANEVYFINNEGAFLFVSGAFYVEKEAVADIVSDNGRNVLRLRNTYILQRNDVMDIPERTETSEEGYTYSFALFYRAVRPGTLKAGFVGTELYVEQAVQPSDSYQKLTCAAKWDETGDFRIETDGEVYIYGVSLFADEVADALIKLETKIEQTDEYIKLLATKEYVDGETGKIYIKYDSQLQITAEQISGISTKVDTIEGTIESAGWITRAEGVTLFAKKEMENGSAIVNAINVGTGGILIQANRIDLVGAVTFSMLNSSLQNTINGKVDEGDLGTLAYASTISKNNFATSLLNEFNGKMDEADAGALAYLDKVETAQLGTTVISGGHIITSLIDTDSIFANAAYIGNFTIENGWFKCNANPGSDVGYIDMRGTNTRIAFGRDLAPSTAGGGFTCTAIISNKNTADSYGVTYGLDVTATDSRYTRSVAVNCNGGLVVKGGFGVVEELFDGINIAPSNSSFSSASNLRYRRTYIFQPTSDVNVCLPSDTAIDDEFGYFSGGHYNVVDDSAIIIILLVTHWSNYRIYVCSKGGTNNKIINENGETIQEATNYPGFWMGKGDSAILMYYNRNWYIINKNS